MDKIRVEKKLKLFSKEELIQSILTNCYGNEVSRLLYCCWKSRHEKLYQEMVKASEDEEKALADFNEFEKEMATKYGDGKKYCVIKFSHEEFFKWNKLREKWLEKQTANRKANKNLDKFYKEYKNEEIKTD